MSIIWVTCNMVNQFNVVIVYRWLIKYWYSFLSYAFPLLSTHLLYFCLWLCCLQAPCFLLWMTSIRRMCLGSHPGFDTVHTWIFIYSCLTVYSKILVIVNLNSTILFASIHVHCISFFSYKMILKMEKVPWAIVLRGAGCLAIPFEMDRNSSHYGSWL